MTALTIKKRCAATTTRFPKYSLDERFSWKFRTIDLRLITKAI